jgi:hypothetical protein
MSSKNYALPIIKTPISNNIYPISSGLTYTDIDTMLYDFKLIKMVGVNVNTTPTTGIINDDVTYSQVTGMPSYNKNYTIPNLGNDASLKIVQFTNTIKKTTHYKIDN